MNKQPFYVILTLVLVVAMVLIALLVPTRAGLQWWLWAWIINLALMFVLLGTISLSVGARGGWWAFLVNDQNMVSLSRFQIVLWTLVVLSAFLTIGLARVGDWTSNADAYVCAAPAEGEEPPEEALPCADPLGLQLPEVLWALMGISTTTAVLSPLIKDDKARRTGARGDRDAYGLMLAETVRGARLDPNEFRFEGAIAVRNPGYAPRFSDLFMGELVSNLGYVDINKVQNFLFTVVAVVSYAIALGAALVGAESIARFFQFPDVSASLLAILGISHSGYLVGKATTNPPA